MQCFGHFDSTNKILVKANGAVIYAIPVKDKNKTFEFKVPRYKADDREAIAAAKRWVLASESAPWDNDMTKSSSGWTLTTPAQGVAR